MEAVISVGKTKVAGPLGQAEEVGEATRAGFAVETAPGVEA